MSDSFAEAMETLAFRLDVYDDLEVRTALASTGWVDVLNTAKADVNSDFGASMNQSYELDREALAVVLTEENVSAGTAPFFEDIAQQTKSVSASAEEQFRDLFDYMHTNALLVNSREFSMGTPTNSGITGNGEVQRCSIDDRGYNMEGWFADSYTMECVEDSNQLTVQFEEIFLVKGQNAAIDNLQRTGSGIEDELQCWSERNTETFVQNPGFENYSATVPTAGSPQEPTSLSGWTTDSGGFTNLEVQVDQLWRTPPGSSTSISLTFTDNERISQDLVDVGGTVLDQNTPYAVGIAVYRRDSCDGSFIITLGGVSRTVTMAGQGNNEWGWVWLVPSPNRNNWYEAFKGNDLTLSYELTGRTTGEIVLDGGLFGPFTLIGGGDGVGRGAMGTYLFVRSGTTPFVGGAGGRTGDLFSWTDSESATRAKNQFWTAIGGVGYYPSTSAGYEQILDK